jgi:hypothetical protein
MATGALAGVNRQDSESDTPLLDTAGVKSASTGQYLLKSRCLIGHNSTYVIVVIFKFPEGATCNKIRWIKHLNITSNCCFSQN